MGSKKILFCIFLAVILLITSEVAAAREMAETSNSQEVEKKTNGGNEAKYPYPGGGGGGYEDPPGYVANPYPYPGGPPGGFPTGLTPSRFGSKLTWKPNPCSSPSTAISNTLIKTLKRLRNDSTWGERPLGKIEKKRLTMGMGMCLVRLFFSFLKLGCLPLPCCGTWFWRN
ncbi:unnamed protein product [Fraxinus pennsylvanica]|uniref:Glycine-rich protein n=1 Tax=Fraxinus pennsylvanica TaxID=56036 RepID=A0AAD1ZWW8_9LAMI|nr:unnamed protein product [Fraxinus pennsylvanica]